MRTVKRLLDEHAIIQIVNKILKSISVDNTPKNNENIYIEKCIYFLFLYIESCHKIKEEILISSFLRKYERLCEKNKISHKELSILLEDLREKCLKWRMDTQTDTYNCFLASLNVYIEKSAKHMRHEEEFFFKKIESLSNHKLDNVIYSKFLNLEKFVIDKDMLYYMDSLFSDIFSTYTQIL
jgi:hemerythrin-like domain-containing protein